MDVIKTLLAGCGALALLSVVGCVGLVGAGSYAVEQAIDEERAREQSRISRALVEDGKRSSRSHNSQGFSEDPFSDYQAQSYDDDGERIGGWGDEAR